MPFGLKMSKDVFQMHMDQVTDHPPALLPCMKIYSSMATLLNNMTGTSWSSCRQHPSIGVVFNKSKCQIRQPQITFYSTVFTTKDMQLNLSKIQALQDLPTPKSPTKLQSFLGLINYLQPFIPRLANKMMFFWGQNIMWDWNPLTHTAFQCLKAWISQTLLNIMIAHYNWSRLVIVQTDTSKYSLGCSPHPMWQAYCLHQQDPHQCWDLLC